MIAGSRPRSAHRRLARVIGLHDATFFSGSAIVDVELTPTNDALAEGEETIVLALGASQVPPGAAPLYADPAGNPPGAPSSRQASMRSLAVQAIDWPLEDKARLPAQRDLQPLLEDLGSAELAVWGIAADKLVKHLRAHPALAPELNARRAAALAANDLDLGMRIGSILLWRHSIDVELRDHNLDITLREPTFNPAAGRRYHVEVEPNSGFVDLTFNPNVMPLGLTAIYDTVEGSATVPALVIAPARSGKVSVDIRVTRQTWVVDQIFPELSRWVDEGGAVSRRVVLIIPPQPAR